MAKIGNVSACDSCRNAEICKYANCLKRDVDDIVVFAKTKSELLTINFLCEYYESGSR